MQVAVIVFPASNCDRDVAVALHSVIGKKPLMVWHRDTELPDVDLVVLPGGFSYGDYLRCGAMAARSPVMREVKKRAAEGMMVLGICNGFQVLTEAGLLPGALMRNRGLKFICRDVYLRVEQTDSPFTCLHKAGDVVRYPIAHAEGNYFASATDIDRLEGEGGIAFRYCDSSGLVNDAANPNGSLGNIAGIFSPDRRILGLMPHPERLADTALGGVDGKILLASMLEALS